MDASKYLSDDPRQMTIEEETSTVAKLERMTRTMLEQATAQQLRMTAIEKSLERVARDLASTPPQQPQYAPQPHATPGIGSLDQVLQVAKALRDVAAPAPQTTMQDAIAMMMSVLELREKIAGSVVAPTEAGGVASMLPMLIGPLSEMLARESDKQKTPQPSQRTRQAVAQPATLSIPATTEPVRVTPVVEMLNAIPQWARMAITQQAAVNADPGTFADSLLAMIPESLLDTLAGTIAPIDDAIEEILMKVPAWIPYKAWLRKLLDAIYARLVEEIDADTAETASPDSVRAEPIDDEPFAPIPQ